MEPADSTAPTVSVTSLREAVSEARVLSLLERTMPVLASKARILVVDESLPARLQMKAALETVAALIDFADSIEQATRLLDGTRYHLIFIEADGTITSAAGPASVSRFMTTRSFLASRPSTRSTKRGLTGQRAPGRYW